MTEASVPERNKKRMASKFMEAFKKRAGKKGAAAAKEGEPAKPGDPADTNKDGKLSKDELKAKMQRMRSKKSN